MHRAINTGTVIALLSSLAVALIFALSSFNPLVIVMMAGAALFFVSVFYLQPDLIIKSMFFVAFLVPFQYVSKFHLITNERYFKLLNFLNPLTFLGGVLFIWLVSRILKRQDQKNRLRLDGVDILYACFIIFSLLSTVNAKSKLGALNWIFYSLVTGFAVYKGLSIYTLEKVKKILIFLETVATLSAVYGIVEYFSGYSFLMGRFQERLTSSLGHPLYSGLMYAAALPTGFALYADTKKVRYLVSVFILAMAVVLTFARGSWIALILGLMVMIPFLPSKTKIKLIFFGAILAVVVAGVPFFRESISARLASNEAKGYSSFDIRLRSIPLAFEIIRESPWFGVGPFNASRHQYENSYSQTLRQVGSFENTYLELLVDLGVMGFACFLGIIFIGIKRIFFFRPKDPPRKIYQASFAACLVIVLINIATFNFDSNRLFHFVLWFYLGLGLNHFEA